MKHHFLDNSRGMAVSRLREMVVSTSQREDFGTIAACLILCALIEYFYRNFAAAAKYLVQLVSTTCVPAL